MSKLRVFRLTAITIAGISLLILTFSALAATGGDTAETAPLFTEAFTDSDSTIGANDDYNLGGATNTCAGDTVWFFSGQGPDLVYKLNSPQTCQANLTLTPLTETNLTLYVVTDTINLADSCLAFSDSGSSGISESVAFTATGNTDYYIIIDGFNDEGSYAVDLTCGTDPTPIDIAIHISDTPDPILAGQPLTYNLIVTNTDTSNAASGVKVTSQLPTGTAHAGNSCGATVTNTGLTWSIGNLPNGISQSCEVTVNVPVTATGMLSNQVLVSADQADPTPENNSAIASTPVIPVTTDLSLKKRALVSEAAPDSLVTYTLTFSNIGSTTATDVTITDILPKVLTNVNTSASGVEVSLASNSPHTWNVPNLALGETGVITIQGQILSSITDQVVTNSAVITHNGPDLNLINNNDTASLAIRNPILVYSISPNDNKLRVANLANGTTISEVTINLPGEIVQEGYGLARHPLTGQLWALLKIQGNADHALVTIDHTTGDAIYIGNTGDTFAGLAFDVTGILYGITDDFANMPETLFSISMEDATATSFLALHHLDDGEAVAYNPDDGLIYHASGSDNDVSEIWESINVASKTVNNIPISGADYDEATALYYLGAGRFIIVDVVKRLYQMTINGMITTLSRSLDHRSRGFALTNFGGFTSAPKPNSTIDIGTTISGTTVTSNIAVTETGDATLRVGVPTDGLITGLHASDFSVSQGLPPFSLADGSPGQNVNIHCTPKDVGIRTATLRFALENPAYPTVSYQLKCTGVLETTQDNAFYLPLLLK